MKKPQTIRLDTLHPDPRNPRTIKAEALDTLCRLVAKYPKFMALRPIVIDADGRIVAGTQRHKACMKNGMTEIPAEWVRRATDLTPEELKAFQVVDNVNAGEFDMEMLTADWDIPDLEAMGVEIKKQKVEDELPEKIEDLRPMKRLHILVSMTVDQSLDLLPKIEALAVESGAEVIHAGN